MGENLQVETSIGAISVGSGTDGRTREPDSLGVAPDLKGFAGEDDVVRRAF